MPERDSHPHLGFWIRVPTGYTTQTPHEIHRKPASLPTGSSSGTVRAGGGGHHGRVQPTGLVVDDVKECTVEPKTEKDGTLIWEGTAVDAVEVSLASGEVLTVHGPVALLPSGVVLVPGVEGAVFALSPGAWGQIHPAGSRLTDDGHSSFAPTV